jgi:hypothetical protein
MKRVVFREGLDATRRRRALDVAGGWGVRADLVAPRTYHLHGQDPMVDAVVRALVKLELIETAQAGEA